MLQSSNFFLNSYILNSLFLIISLTTWICIIACLIVKFLLDKIDF